ncbi:hypothetical protein FAVG1_12872 [Fusarium avenaceum]|nr:hypothetical protein FAVG1_12872 [Fusarium avenaceum]
MQMAQDLNVTVVLGVWAGIYLDGQTVPKSELQAYVDEAMILLDFLTVRPLTRRLGFKDADMFFAKGSMSSTYGANRAALGYVSPFIIDYIEVGNEDYLNGETNSYYSYRFMGFYNKIRNKYPNMNIVSTINPNSLGASKSGVVIDLHIYDNEAHLVSLFNTFDQASRKYTVFVGEYASIRTGSTTNRQVGAQTFGMACAEAVLLLGCERNSVSGPFQ